MQHHRSVSINWDERLASALFLSEAHCATVCGVWRQGPRCTIQRFNKNQELMAKKKSNKQTLRGNKQIFKKLP